MVVIRGELGHSGVQTLPKLRVKPKGHCLPGSIHKNAVPTRIDPGHKLDAAGAAKSEVLVWFGLVWFGLNQTSVVRDVDHDRLKTSIDKN